MIKIMTATTITTMTTTEITTFIMIAINRMSKDTYEPRVHRHLRLQPSV